MSFPVQLDRDIAFHEFGDKLNFPTTFAAVTYEPHVRTDGVVYGDRGRFWVRGSLDLIANHSASVGVNIEAPEGEYTLYSVIANAQSFHSQVGVYAFCCIGHETPDSAGGGQAISRSLLLAAGVGDSYSSHMSLEQTIAIAPLTGSFAERSLVFGLCFYAHGTTLNPPSSLALGHMHVQRLVGRAPRYINRRIM